VALELSPGAALARGIDSAPLLDLPWCPLDLAASEPCGGGSP
jgi:hypothetical protein